MHAKNIKTLPQGMQSFLTYSAIPVGSNTFDKTNSTKSVLNKSSTSSAALQTMDMGRLAAGTTITVEVDVRCTSLTAGSATVEINSRSNYGIIDGRKIVAVATTTASEWTTLRIDWIVAAGGNWISLAYGASTASQGVFEFRNPRISIDADRYLKDISFNLQRVSGVWSVDGTNYHNNGAYLVSSSGDTITVGWPGVDESRAPVVTVTVDTGFSLAAAGFVSAGPNTVVKDGCKIKLIQADGAFKADVTTGGTTRLHVLVSF